MNKFPFLQPFKAVFCFFFLSLIYLYKVIEDQVHDWAIIASRAAFLVKVFTASSSLWIDFFKFSIKPLLISYCPSISWLRFPIKASDFSIDFSNSERWTISFSLLNCFMQRPFVLSFKIISRVFSLPVWSLFLFRDLFMFYFNAKDSP